MSILARRNPVPGSRAALLSAALACALVCALACAPTPAAAWSLATHRRIVADAAALLPQPMRDRLGQLADLQSGTLYPDSINTGREHHIYCPDGSCGDAPATVAGGFRAIVADFRSTGLLDILAAIPAALLPAGCSSRADADPDPIRDGNLAFRLGVVAHYLADVNVPYHTIPYTAPAQIRHPFFENEFDVRFSDVTATFDGRFDDVGGDPAAATAACAGAAHEVLPFVDDPGTDHASARYRDTVAGCYGRAVNAVADLWYSVLLRLPER